MALEKGKPMKGREECFDRTPCGWRGSDPVRFAVALERLLDVTLHEGRAALPPHSP